MVLDELGKMLWIGWRSGDERVWAVIVFDEEDEDGRGGGCVVDHPRVLKEGRRWGTSAVLRRRRDFMRGGPIESNEKPDNKGLGVFGRESIVG